MYTFIDVYYRGIYWYPWRLVSSQKELNSPILQKNNVDSLLAFLIRSLHDLIKWSCGLNPDQFSLWTANILCTNALWNLRELFIKLSLIYLWTKLIQFVVLARPLGKFQYNVLIYLLIKLNIHTLHEVFVCTANETCQ